MTDSSQQTLDTAAEAAAAAGGNQAEALPPAALPSAAGLSEAKVQNAVAFLSHPKVKSASVESKRAFLEGKGLNAAEIDEGFRRVPESSAAGVGAGAQAAPTKPFPVGGAATTTLNALQPGQPAYPQQIVVQQPPPPPQTQPVRWTQVVLGAGALVAGAYVVKQYVIPFTSQAYERWAGKPLFGQSAAERAAEARTAELIAKAIQGQSTELRSAVDSLKEMVKGLDRRPAPGLQSDTLSLSDLRSELRNFATSLSEFGGVSAGTSSSSSSSIDVKALQEELRQLKAMVADSSHRTQQPPASYAAQGSQGGLRPGTQHKWGTSHDGQESPSSFNGDPGHASSNGGVSGARPGASAFGATPASTPSTPPPHPASYMEVLDMLERGETPPNVRKDINDKPPNPNVPPPAAKLKPRPKPWEKANGHAAHSGESVPPAAPSQPGPTPDSPFKPGSVSYAASGSSFSGRPNALPGSTGFPLSASSSASGPNGYPLDASNPPPDTSSSQYGAGNPRTNGSTTDDTLSDIPPPELVGASGTSASSQAGAVQVARAGSGGAPTKTGYLGALMKGRAEALSTLRNSPSQQNGQVPDTEGGTGAGSSSQANRPWVPPAAPIPSLPTRRPSPSPVPASSTPPSTTDVGTLPNGKASAANGKSEGSMYDSREGTGMGESEAKSMPHLTHEQEASSSDRMANGMNGMTGGKSDVQSYSLEDSFHDGSFSDGASSPTHPLPDGTLDAIGNGQHGNGASQAAAAHSRD